MYFDIILGGIDISSSNSSRQTVNSNNSTIRVSNATINGNNNDVIGDNNKVTGNNNDVKGHKNLVTGNNNDVKGDFNTVSGNNCDAKGFECIVFGNNCDYIPTKKPKESSKQWWNDKTVNRYLEMVEEVKKEGKFSIYGSHSKKLYYGETPEEAMELMKAGERFHYEQRQLDLRAKLEQQRMEMEYNTKIQARRWDINNVNLSDEEYKELEEYIDSIKELWETW